MTGDAKLRQLGQDDLIRLDRYRPDIAFGSVWFAIFIGSILVQLPWLSFHGAIFLLTGGLIAFSPPVKCLPRIWWVLAFVFALGAMSAFLPANWFEFKRWREDLGGVGLDTGNLVVIQWQFAAERLGVFLATLFTGMWMSGHRISSENLRRWSMLFVWGVAVYAVASWIVYYYSETPASNYGFFPNRNHTATYLAMGVVCGLGSIVQAIRDKRFLTVGLALFPAGICLWAACAWSSSRAGILLISVGALGWAFLLGKRYLGRHGIWAVCLLALATVGMFVILDSVVKERIADTLEKTESLVSSSAEGDGSGELSGVDLDFRIPTALDTFDLIGDHFWTGVGAGQFYFIFPQYRNLTSVASNADNHHPESDWLWMAAETGVPATACLVLLVLLALGKSLRSLLRGKDRALRSACLVGAALVPFHGLFDVPGHRITLALSSIFLYSLSLGGLSRRSLGPIPSKVPYRTAGLLISGFGLFMLSSLWFGTPRFASQTAASAIAEAKRLYREDQVLQEAAAAANLEYQPDPDEDLLEEALAILDDASLKVPLDRRIPRFKAYLAFYFDDKQTLIERSFAQESALDPTWVEAPYRHGLAWAEVDAARVLPLWKEALGRAERVGVLDSDNARSRPKIFEKMENFAKGRPKIEDIVDELKGTESDTN